MASFLALIRAMFRPTPPPTEDELQRMAQARPATDDEIAEAKAKHGWKTSLPGAG